MKSLLLKAVARWWSPFFIMLTVLVFFWQFFLYGKLPIPADTIVGLYHPWRDVEWNGFTAGVPFKNFLITDPVRQQFPWRELAVHILRQGKMPTWNPYTFAGTPLMANMQTAVFYPLNLIFVLLPFSIAWSLLVIMQPLLGSLFLYFYLRNLATSKKASILGAVTFAFSGFSVAWMTWNTLVHSLVWLPLILLTIDKIYYYLSQNSARWSLKVIHWLIIFVFSLSTSFLAGHLQIFFYVFSFSSFYALMRWLEIRKSQKIIFSFILISGYLLFILISSLQWLPVFQFISLSDRIAVPTVWQKIDWFLPWQHLTQFLAPDFFGNPTTMNYWGVWNYGEFVGYVGVVSFFFAIIAIIFRRDGKAIFFSFALIAAFILALPTPIAKIPFFIGLPFVSTSQPSRLMAIIDFSLAVLAAFGFDYYAHFLEKKNISKFFLPFFVICLIFIGLWISIWIGVSSGNSQIINHLTIAEKNLLLPTVLLLFVGGYLLVLPKLIDAFRVRMRVISWGILLIIIFDLFRFGWKFTPFSSASWLYPSTKAILFLQSQPQPYRFMTTDSRIFPPNFSIAYHLQTVDGYDPLFLKRYGQFVGAWLRGQPDLRPTDFNRILTPQDYSSRLADLVNVRFVLSLKDENSPKLRFVLREGETRIYENTAAFPRAFFVQNVVGVQSADQALEFLFDAHNDLRRFAVVEDKYDQELSEFLGEDETVKTVFYSENEIQLQTKTKRNHFLVLTDSYYPGWQAFVDGVATSIFLTDFNFRGIVVPAGYHTVKFKYQNWLYSYHL